MNKTLFALVSTALLLVVPGCAADSDDDSPSETDAPLVPLDDGLAIHKMTPRPTYYTPRVRRADILAGGGSCASSLCTASNGTMWQCSGTGYCDYLGRGN